MAVTYRSSKGWSRPVKGAFAGKIAQRRASEMRDFIRGLPLYLAHVVARESAPKITVDAGAAYDGGRTVYGDARPLSKAGEPLSLVQSTATRKTVRFVADGRIIRCALGTPYAKYLIGKYKILPVGNGPMPVAWKRKLQAAADAAFAATTGSP